MSEIKNPGKSIRAKLLNVAKQKDVFYQTILTRYFQERLLYRISQTRYRENFYLKGGALMYAYKKSAPSPPPGKRCTTQTKQTIVYLHRQRRTHYSIFPMLLLLKEKCLGHGFSRGNETLHSDIKDIGH